MLTGSLCGKNHNMHFTVKQLESRTILLLSSYVGVGIQIPIRTKFSFRTPHCISWRNCSYIQHGGP